MRRAIDRLTLRQRIALVAGRDFWTTAEVPGVVPSVMLTDGPHGVRRQRTDNDHVGLGESIPATCFPVAAALAGSWDPDLLAEVGQALGAEARAQDVAVLLGPGLNIKRHPRGGRNFEYFSEDPLLSGRLAAALVRGIQTQGVAACPKHFAANNQETERMVIDTIIDERTLREIYLRGFEIVIAEASPRALMTAYNQVNGQFCSDHEYLLARVLRSEWGFDGLVVSDWGGSNDHVAGLRVGMDLEMPGGAGIFDADIEAAVESGSLLADSLLASAARVAGIALGWRESLDTGAPSDVDLDAHHALARRAAIAGTVLLANDGILPLSAGTIGVIGAYAEQPRYQGAGSSRVNPTRVDSVLAALTAAGRGGTASPSEVRFAPGYRAEDGSSTPGLIAEAASVAAEVDAAILVVGMPATWETEAMDRPAVRLPADMEHLIEVVLLANPRTVIVLQNGAAFEMPWADRPAAIIEAYLGGQAGGSALAEILLGTAEPGGRLAESIPIDTADLAADCNFPGVGRQVEYREGPLVGYRFHDTAGVPARFPFGHGLGYTTFQYSGLSVSGLGTDLSVEVTLTNTGSRAGSHVVQLYVGVRDSVVHRPAKELKAFERVALGAGESRVVTLGLDRRCFAVWDTRVQDWLIEAGDYDLLIGASSVDIRQQAMIRLDVGDSVAAGVKPAGPVATDAEFEALLGRSIPVPRSARPFDRNTTIVDLETTVAGRGVAALLRRALAKEMSPDDHNGGAQMIDSIAASMPLRAFAQVAGGRLSMGLIDRTIALLNGLSRLP